MARRAASAEGTPGPQGPQGPQGEAGLDGADGAQGAAGPAGLGAEPATPIATPTPNNATFSYPPTGTLGPDHRLFLCEFVCQKRDGALAVTNASRKALFVLMYYGEPGAAAGNIAIFPLVGWVNSTAPLTLWGVGNTSVTPTLVTLGGGQCTITFACVGPTPVQEPDGCSWSGIVVPLGSQTVPV